MCQSTVERQSAVDLGEVGSDGGAESLDSRERTAVRDEGDDAARSVEGEEIEDVNRLGPDVRVEGQREVVRGVEFRGDVDVLECVEEYTDEPDDMNPRTVCAPPPGDTRDSGSDAVAVPEFCSTSNDALRKTVRLYHVVPPLTPDTFK